MQPYKFIIKSLLLLITIGASITVASSFASNSFGFEPAQNQALDYLIQKVCVEPSGHVLNIDPYNCPAGDSLRPLKTGEALPYHKHDQPNRQRHDSYPMRDIAGDTISINRFEYAPFGHFKAATDGYDIYEVHDGWATGPETKDNGGFSTTFYGTNCSPNGWVFFPLNALTQNGIKSGSVYMPVKGVYWEHDGESWPGSCPSHYSKETLTTWDFIPNFPFSGVMGNSSKPLDTIRVAHGFKNTANWLAHGHVEVFYFTKLYGVTRWEDWTPAQRLENTDDEKLQKNMADAASNCSGSPHITYQGQKFIRKYCRDWSSVTPVTEPESAEVWPVPDMNLLQNFHFSDGTKGWNRTGKSIEGNPINLEPKNSTASLDIKHSSNGIGVRYLAINCAGNCSNSEALYQDVPVSSIITSGTYFFGLTARTENEPGVLQVTLSQIDNNGQILDSKTFQAKANANNERVSGTDSVLLSSGFFSASEPIKILPRTSALRLSIAPKTTGTFDIVDTWLMKNTY